MNRLDFVDVLPVSQSYKRKSDLSSFEYSYKAEITSVYSLTDTEKLVPDQNS